MFVSADGRLKLGDFGLSRSKDQTSMTAAGATLGTPEYMAPEITLGIEQGDDDTALEERFTPKCDIWSFGVVCYVLIFNATVNRAWRTSMEIGCKVEAQDAQKGPRRHILSAYLTFVGTGEDRRPIPIPSLTPQSADERRRHQEADLRRQMRLQHAADLKALRGGHAS